MIENGNSVIISPVPVTKPRQTVYNGPPGFSLPSAWSFHFLLGLNCRIRRSRFRLNKYDRTAPTILHTTPILHASFPLYSLI